VRPYRNADACRCWWVLYPLEFSVRSVSGLILPNTCTSEAALFQGKDAWWPAPELQGNRIEWINAAPILLKDLRGKLVVLDFWTSCCINCIQSLPALKLVEGAFPLEVQVIGIHCAKFDSEKKAAHVRASIDSNGIQHPVLNDPDFEIWGKYGIRGWPTLALIAPDGTLFRKVYGELNPDKFAADIGRALGEWRSSNSLVSSPAFAMQKSDSKKRLSFPSGIRSADDGTCFVADTGHNQVVVIGCDGTELLRIGSGNEGLTDGDRGRATFRAPQGLALSDTHIIVADTGNHALRSIDRNSGFVETLAGTGLRGGVLPQSIEAKFATLASPWDVVEANGNYIFANAGTHQLGVYLPASNRVAHFAGDGHEGLLDGAARAAHLAQPSGLALSAHDGLVYFVDSETSAVRRASLGASGTVSTLIGRGLFDFGHRNGLFDEALLQHPLALAVFEHRIAVADTYNDVIRFIDLEARIIADLGEGFLCRDELCLPLSRPAGVCFLDAKALLVADTNNHRILRFDLASRSYSTWFE
jgi:sugar lactone lactonase YvrE/peroxiredoxin